MRIAYTVPGATSSAFTPVPCINGAALNYKGGVVGQPGTRAVPAPWPGTFNDIFPLGYQGGQSESYQMPPVMYPNLYYMSSLDIPGSDVISGGMQIWSDNQMPVPAAMPGGQAAMLSRPVNLLGQRQVKQPRGGRKRWPDWLPAGFGS